MRSRGLGLNLSVAVLSAWNGVGCSGAGSSATETDADEAVFSNIDNDDQYISGLEFGVDSVYRDYSITKSQSGTIYRFEVRDGDVRPGETRNRSELSGSPNKFSVGTEIWLSYSFLHETGTPLVNAWNNLGQWHAGSGSPVITMQVTDDNVMRFLSRSGVSSSHIQVTRYQDNSFVRGRWYHFVQHMKFDSAGNAIAQIWIDGVLRVNVSGESVGYTDSTENYFKFGIYREPSAITQAVRFANMEIGTASLAHRVGNPLPIVP